MPAFGGFAEKLADELAGHQSRADRRMEVYGDTCSGHSFYNPFVTCFPARELIVPPRTRLFRQWREALRRGDLWARFAFMSDEAMQAEITGG